MTPRRVWIIVPLTFLFGPFALVYCGRLKRAVVWELIKWSLAFLALGIMLYFPSGRIAVVGGVALIIFVYLAIFLDAYRISRGANDESPRVYQRWWAYLALLVAFIGFNQFVLHISKVYCQEAFFMPTGGMQPTLYVGDRFLVNKLGFPPGSPQRGQVVAFRVPGKEDTIYVKRIVALEGDSIRIENDKVFVNDQLLEEPYALFEDPKPQGTYNTTMRHYLPTKVPEGHCFVLGDNRWRSMDSRWFGFVPLDNLLGQARVVFWSREYEFVQPNRQQPDGGEKWGKLRLERIGKLIR